MPRRVVCPYCDRPAERVTGFTLFGMVRLADKHFYRCAPCDAHVGCHPKSSRPLGTLANAELRRARREAHAAFDPIWRSHTLRRSEAYAWLATKLGITEANCHIGLFDLEMCRRVVDISRIEGDAP